MKKCIMPPTVPQIASQQIEELKLKELQLEYESDLRHARGDSWGIAVALMMAAGGITAAIYGYVKYIWPDPAAFKRSLIVFAFAATLMGLRYLILFNWKRRLKTKYATRFMVE